MAEKFSGKVVIITGSSCGIGAETAIHFAKLGANVVITGRNLENLNIVAEKCKINNKNPLVIQADVTKTEDLSKIIDCTIQNFGKLDILVNNAGIFEVGGVQEANLDQWDKVYNTNIRAIFQLTKLAIPYLIKTKGNIVNVSSIAGMGTFSTNIIYCTSKSALDQFTKCVALELASKQVRVNSVNPGVIETQIFYKTSVSKEEADVYLEDECRLHPLNRIGRPEEVAHAIAFLASDKAKFMTGVLLPIDGGRLLCTK